MGTIVFSYKPLCFWCSKSCEVYVAHIIDWSSPIWFHILYMWMVLTVVINAKYTYSITNRIRMECCGQEELGNLTISSNFVLYLLQIFLIGCWPSISTSKEFYTCWGILNRQNYVHVFCVLNMENQCEIHEEC